MFRLTRPPNDDVGEQVYTVVIVDHHPCVRYTIRHLFQGEPDIDLLDEAETGKQALDLIHTLRPDVLILEHRLPDMTAFDVLDQIKVSTVKSSTAPPA